MQASQVIKARFKEVLGDDRRFIKLPSLKNNGIHSARTGTGQTHIIMLWIQMILITSIYFILFILRLVISFDQYFYLD